MLLLKAEPAGHPATTGIEQFILQSEPTQDLFFRRHAHDAFLMAMGMDQRFSVEMHSGISRSEAGYELAQRKGLTAQALGILVVRHQVREFIAKDRAATRFQNNERGAFGNRRA